jgi:ATP-dependent Clp protease adaptor protein ClpS
MVKIKEKSKKKELLKSETESLKESVLILHNDEVNTFDYVIEMLIRICGHSPNQAEQCAFLTHYKGKCEVKKGTYEQLKLFKESLNDKGLNTTIETL